LLEYTGSQLSKASVLADIAIGLHESECFEETAGGVVRSALQLLGCSHAGLVLLGRGGRLQIAAVTDPAVEAIYQWQLSAGYGPLIAAVRGREPVRVPDAAEESRWRGWAEIITGLGIRSVLHVPMLLGDRVGGVLSFYSEEPDAFSDQDEAVAHILARHASVAVATARKQEDLAQAIDARKLIGQAMGILMERFDLDGDRAFEVLKRYSQDTNTKLRDVAQQLVDTRLLPAQRRTAGSVGAAVPVRSPGDSTPARRSSRPPS
jgi:GAF domain-containing protein